jgi:DNA-binding MarR family transcriptional regulator
MAQRLADEIQQRKPFGSLAEEAFLALQRTAGLLLLALGRELKEHDLSPAQYNLLRVLRGASESEDGALTCGEIGERLVSPGPDVTRLLDRLESRHLLRRERDPGDRRVVRARITAPGLALLQELDRPVDAALERLLGHLEEGRLRELLSLLASAREHAHG